MSPLFVALLITAGTPAEPGRDKLRFGLEYRWWGRNLQSTGAASLATLSVGPEPTGVTFDIQWFPLSHFLDDWRADVGMAVRADIAPEFRIPLGDTNIKGSVARLRTAVMFRVPFHHVEPSVNLGFQAFEASTALKASDGSPRPRLPNVSLTGPRLGLGLRLLEFWRVAFDLGVGATWLVTTGELGLAAWFPGAKGNAFDGNIGLAFHTWSFLDVRLGVDLTVHTLLLAKGVVETDTYYGVSLGLIFKGIALP